MSTRVEAPTDTDYVGAIRLAQAATANLESEHKVIERILAQAADTPPEALWPTKILITAINDLGGTVDVP